MSNLMLFTICSIALVSASQSDYFWLEDGCPTAGSSPAGKFASRTSSVGEVQCCTDAGVCTRAGCLSGNNDAAMKTYDEAVALCEGQGWRLCTKEELVAPDASGCCSTGCMYDGDLVWTSSPAPRHWLEEGCKDKGAVTRRLGADNEEVGEVQCCGTGMCTRSGCLSGNNDAAKYNYDEAVALCAGVGLSLCTSDELLASTSSGCCGSGCQLDRTLVWSSTSATVEVAGTSCTGDGCVASAQCTSGVLTRCRHIGLGGTDGTYPSEGDLTTCIARGKNGGGSVVAVASCSFDYDSVRSVVSPTGATPDSNFNNQAKTVGCNDDETLLACMCFSKWYACGVDSGEFAPTNGVCYLPAKSGNFQVRALCGFIDHCASDPCDWGHTCSSGANTYTCAPIAASAVTMSNGVTFFDATTATISSDSATALCYTMDGSAPTCTSDGLCDNGAKKLTTNSDFSVSMSTTINTPGRTYLKAVACAPGSSSGIVTEQFDAVAETPTSTRVGGINMPLVVGFGSQGAIAICYSWNSASPSCTVVSETEVTCDGGTVHYGELYEQTLTTEGTMSVIGCSTGGISMSKSFAFTHAIAETPTTLPAPEGGESYPLSVHLGSSFADAICYTTDGSTPACADDHVSCTSGNTFGDNFGYVTLLEESKIKAQGCTTGGDSAVAVFHFGCSNDDHCGIWEHCDSSGYCADGVNLGRPCGAHDHCLSGHCTTSSGGLCEECNNDADCGSGQYCKDVVYTCESKKGNSVVNYCGRDGWCNSDHCHSEFYYCTECESNSECAADEYCSDIEASCKNLLSIGEVCNNNGECNSGTCTPDLASLNRCASCVTDNDCSSSQFCSQTEMKCLGLMGNGECCCTSDSQCSSNICVGGFCQECENNNDCSSSQYCGDVSYQCHNLISNGAACLANEECKSGMCDIFFCRECMSHSDCDGDHYCVAWQCSGDRGGRSSWCTEDYHCKSDNCKWGGGSCIPTWQCCT